VTTTEEKRRLIEPGQPQLSIARQCELLGLSRSGYYYQATGETSYNEALMRLIDEQYTNTPYYGVERMTAWLREQAYQVNPKRVRRLMRVMGLEAIYPKPRLSQEDKEHTKYPYLLRDVAIKYPNQVWGADITYIPLARGFAYLVAIMDWFSRYVIAWELSLTLEAEFCQAALEQALDSARPEIFNTDQGAQFTSKGFTEILENHEIKISMDGRGRVFDNIFVERLWRTVKYEEVYLKDYQGIEDARQGLAAYLDFYNQERLHQSLNYKTPAKVYGHGRQLAAAS